MPKKPKLHLLKEGTKLRTRCGQNHGLNKYLSVMLTALNRQVTCRKCRMYIKPWERGEI